MVYILISSSLACGVPQRRILLKTLYHCSDHNACYKNVYNIEWLQVGRPLIMWCSCHPWEHGRSPKVVNGLPKRLTPHLHVVLVLAMLRETKLRVQTWFGQNRIAIYWARTVTSTYFTYWDILHLNSHSDPRREVPLSLCFIDENIEAQQAVIICTLNSQSQDHNLCLSHLCYCHSHRELCAYPLSHVFKIFQVRERKVS